ncbi:NAD(P)H-dependent oxidoreductase [Thauera sinica]|uniref:NAD(P)H-dependent oxidoreductase n=1 Tax=Thauera sinica TaxID=2665146 RepID=A0ABW1AMB4_9RHOO|nr:NAD(P)H-dependent oxidoreductase [Thauera sp. K11]ATE59172.1 NADPH-dependent FMN reductase [Thauera sp. K11]
MSTVVGLSGSLTHPSRTTTLVEAVLDAARRQGAGATHLINIADLAGDLGHALDPRKLPEPVAAAYRTLFAADVIVIATPVYKASYTGLLKHFLDLVDPKELKGKVAVLAATGGSERHALAVEHELRPLAAFFGLHVVPEGIYLKDADFSKLADGSGYVLESGQAAEAIGLAAAQALQLAGALGAAR